MHKRNAFITLTYDDDQLPADNSISKREFQLFMKRLRKELGTRVRFFGCGEYGEKGGRAHYHGLIFGTDFRSHPIQRGRSRARTYSSDLLSKVWPYGHNTVGPVNATTAAYCARYALKKLSGEQAADHYLRPHPLTGELHQVQPEFALMSRRPGLGATWFDQFKGDLYPSDFLIVDGKKRSVPIYYTRKLQEDQQTKLKRARKRAAVRHRDNNTPERLAVREIVISDKLKKFQSSTL